MITQFEHTILDASLAGELRELEVLRKQAASATVRERTMTGVGFFLHFGIPPEAERIGGSGRRTIGCVAAELKGVEHGAGFLLFIQDGQIDFLEGFTYDEPWPRRVVLQRWYYLRPELSQPGSFVEGAERDLNYVASQLAG